MHNVCGDSPHECSGEDLTNPFIYIIDVVNILNCCILCTFTRLLDHGPVDRARNVTGERRGG